MQAMVERMKGADMREIEKTCENCEYENEDMEGTHCRHCIHNAEECFEPKIMKMSEKEIRANAIDEFAERMSLEISESIIWGMLVDSDKDNSFSDTSDKIVDYVVDTAKKIAEQLKGGAV